MDQRIPNSVVFDFENNISARVRESLVQIELLVTLEEYCFTLYT